MSGPFDQELESIAATHTQDFARKLAHEVANHIFRKLGIEQSALTSSGTAGRKKAALVKAVAKAAPAKAAPEKASKASKGASKAKAVVAPAPGKRGRKRSSDEDRTSALEKVLHAVKAIDGAAVADVVKSTGLARGHVAAALKALKQERRIYMGGSRRFARYAMSAAIAERASDAARKGE